VELSTDMLVALLEKKKKKRKERRQNRRIASRSWLGKEREHPVVVTLRKRRKKNIGGT